MIIGADRKRVFASTLTYQLGRELGIERAAREFSAQLEAPSRHSLPVVRLFARLSKMAEVQVYHGASTTLPKARSRAAYEALQSGLDYWLMADDDVECDTDTLDRLLAAVGAPGTPRAVVLPCLMRGAGVEQVTVNVQFEEQIAHTVGRSMLRIAKRAGTGCMVLTREALVQLYGHYAAEAVNADLDGIDDVPFERLQFIDDDATAKLALFQLMITPEGQWLGEDFSFCERLRRAGVPLVALCSGVSMHAGHALDVSSIR